MLDVVGDLEPPFMTLPRIGRRDLPDPVARRIDRLELVRGDLWRYHLTEGGIRLDLADVEVAFYPEAYGPRLMTVVWARRALGAALFLPLILGMLGAIRGVLALVSGPLGWSWWGVSALLVLLGAGLVPVATYLLIHGYPRRRHGLCLMPEGLCRLHEPTEPPGERRYQWLPWEDLRTLHRSGEHMLVAERSDGVSWALSSRLPAERRQAITEWREGRRALRAIAESRAPRWIDLRVGAASIAAVAAACLFFWLVGVLPTTSASGALALEFFAKIRARDLDGAHAMLDAEARVRHPRASLLHTLPAEVVAHRTASINGVQGAAGLAGSSGCVDGSLSLGDDESVAFNLRLSATDDGIRIRRIETGRWCHRGGR